MNNLAPIDKLSFSTELRLSKRVGTVGRLQWIPIDKLVVDRSYQRLIFAAGRKSIRNIAENFDWSLFSPLMVAARDGGVFAIIDGQHRATAAKSRGDIKEVPCLVIDADYTTQAKAFAIINGSVTKVSAQMVHRANAAGGDPDAVRLNEVCARAGVTILGYPKQDCEPGETMAVGTIAKCLERYGDEIVVNALRTVTQTGKGNAGLLREGIIGGTCDVLYAHPKWPIDMVLQAVGKVGVREIYSRALKAKGEGMTASGSARKHYGDKLAATLEKALGDGGSPPPPQNMRVRALNDTTGRRFTGKPHRDPAELKHLSPEHAAVAENRTLFPATVRSAAESERLLISGANNVKLGKKVLKGEWARFPLYQLSLEERATCPPVCANRVQCYGNAMPFARRHKADEYLIPFLNADLVDLQQEHPKGFVVRLHVLGDFYSREYVSEWRGFLDAFPALHVFGYTSWPRDSEIGKHLAELADHDWHRFAMRFSSDHSEPQGAITIWRKPEASTVPEGIVCPAQTDGTACCATCGLCWSEAARLKTIVFVGHGGVGLGRRKAATVEAPKETKKAAPAQPVRTIPLQREKVKPQQSKPVTVFGKASQPSTNKPKMTADATARSVEAFLAEKGVRRFESGATGDPWHLLEWLKRECGRKAERRSMAQGRGKLYEVDGKRYDLDGLLEIVNKERRKRKLEPITVTKKVAA